MTDNQLSGKELYEQQKREREQSRGASQPSAKPKSGGGVWPWVITIIVLVALGFGVYKLATSTPPGGTSTGGTLSEPVSAEDWTFGDRTAAVQLVEYLDFQCPACATYAATLQDLREEFKDEVGFTVRNFPLRQVHPNAQVVAQIVEAAGLQGKYWEASDIVFDRQETWSQQIAVRDSIYSLLMPLKLDMTKLKADVDSKAVKDKIEADYQSGLASGVNSTPTFYLNGKKIAHPAPSQFRQLILDALEDNSTNASSTSTQN